MLSFSSGGMGGGGMDNKRATIVSYLAGMFVAAGFWVLTDAGIQANHNDDPQKIQFEFLLPCIFSLLGLWLLNVWPWSGLHSGDPVQASRCKMALFAALIIHFACIFGALWILIGVYSKDDAKADSTYGGSAIVVCCLSTFAASVILRLGRMDIM